MVKLWVNAVCLYAVLGWIPIVLLFNLVPTNIQMLLFGLWFTADISYAFLDTDLIDYQSSTQTARKSE